jgi:hypothetical protein
MITVLQIQILPNGVYIVLEKGITFHEEQKPYLNIQYQLWYVNFLIVRFNNSLTSSGVDIFAKEVPSFMRGMDEAISIYNIHLKLVY